MPEAEICNQHSGCVADITTLKESDKQQWSAIKSIENKANAILGGVCVSCVLLLINLMVSKV